MLILRDDVFKLIDRDKNEKIDELMTYLHTLPEDAVFEVEDDDINVYASRYDPDNGMFTCILNFAYASPNVSDESVPIESLSVHDYYNESMFVYEKLGIKNLIPLVIILVTVAVVMMLILYGIILQ